MAKALTIYGRIISPYVAALVLASKRKGFNYELMMPKGGIKSPAYYKLNPFAKVPVLKDGTTTLYESAVILEYLDAKSKIKKLIPESAAAGSQTRLIAAVANEYVLRPAIKIVQHKRGTSKEPVDIKTVFQDLEKGLNALERVLVKGPFAAGSRFSLADCVASPILLFTTAATNWYDISDIIGKRPKLKKYWAAIQKNKLAKPVLKDMTAMFNLMTAGKLPPWSAVQ
ncbi:MAG: hypothetical protein CMG46_07410 [Candidatus Marinimicrobia bacterium]|nr:hypothetical protein [Candidatus Neomarinimicrobiota bacterium]